MIEIKKIEIMLKFCEYKFSSISGTGSRYISILANGRIYNWDKLRYEIIDKCEVELMEHGYEFFIQYGRLNLYKGKECFHYPFDKYKKSNGDIASAKIASILYAINRVKKETD